MESEQARRRCGRNSCSPSPHLPPAGPDAGRSGRRAVRGRRPFVHGPPPPLAPWALADDKPRPHRLRGSPPAFEIPHPLAHQPTRPTPHPAGPDARPVAGRARGGAPGARPDACPDARLHLLDLRRPLQGQDRPHVRAVLAQGQGAPRDQAPRQAHPGQEGSPRRAPRPPRPRRRRTAKTAARRCGRATGPSHATTARNRNAKTARPPTGLPQRQGPPLPRLRRRSIGLERSAMRRGSSAAAPNQAPPRPNSACEALPSDGSSFVCEGES